MRKSLEKALSLYLNEIYNIFVSNSFSEGSFYPTLKDLLEKYSSSEGNLAGVVVLPKKTEAGIPDFLIRRNGEIIGYIEAKTPDTNLDSVEDTDQLKRYKESFPNLILTNFLEFRLYRHNNLISKVTVGRQFTLKDLHCKPTPENIDAFSELLGNFFDFSIPEITTSAQLSLELAKRTRFLEYILLDELQKGNEEIIRLYSAFREELIETLTKGHFADLYAQTITYGLFSARMGTPNGFAKEIAWKSIPESLPLLREIFYSFTGPNFPESLSWVVDDIGQVLEKAEIKSILNEFKLTRWEDDPVIHFYETFLATYNPEERQRLGVYYTPLPVVSYIVRSIHKLLKEKFNKEEGLATRDITLLDPAAGTLTFVVQAIKQVESELKEKRKEGLLKSYIEEHILQNFYAFEILVAPYTIGHFKVAMILEEMGYKLSKDKRFQFYLTNTLEMKEPKQLSVLTNLTKEGQEAKRIKERIPILVVLGNPPYSVSSENKSEFIEQLMNDYKEDVRDERNIQPLSDDYIKFIRFAHWKITQAGKGIVGIITNNAYLSGIIHRGMRRKLLDTFDEIYILNLHGSSRIGEKTPDGGKDENVFDIQQGVAIVLYVKFEKPLKDKKVFYQDVWGLREEKYKYLFKNDVKITKWQKLEPVAPYYFFVKMDFSLREEHEKFWKISEMFKEWSFGVTTSRDHFVIGLKKEEIVQRLSIFTGNLPDDLISQSLNLEDTGTWNLHEARQKTKGLKLEDKIYPYAYRPFDNRSICYDSSLIERDRMEVMQHMINRENFGLNLTRRLRDPVWRHVYVTSFITDKTLLSSRDNCYFFPLFLYPNSPQKQLLENKAKRITNFSDEFLNAIKESIGKELMPEEIFNYIYAILFSPAYRKRYEEFLKIDFPRIPLPKDYNSFNELGKIGNELTDLHLLKHQALQKTEVGFPKSGSNKVEKVRYDEENKRVFINKEQYFDRVLKEVYDYKIGAYQVMGKYLKDRKDRKLTLDEINHYLKIAKAIKLTIDLQQKLDKVNINIY
jgi:predicted helicase